MSLPTSPLALLNNLTPEQFLAEYWQKKPLLIRQAIPDFEGLLTPSELAGLACETGVEARIVQHTNNQWQVDDAPFDEDDFTSLPDYDWTLLVQSVNYYLPEAAELLRRFNFIPHARLDDLMISYAPKGGSVGAHLDSYDVFLLQGSGTRRWQISDQTDLSIVEDAPLRLLKNFKAQQEWVLTPGDMLYLPPNIAHHGVSEDNDCMTYSIGFRSPKKQELTHAFLEFLQDTLQVEGLYQDSDLVLQDHPAELSHQMIDNVKKMLQSIRWNKETVSDFLARYLSEPKPDIVFSPPKQLSLSMLIKVFAKKRLMLDLKSQLLFFQDRFYMNGEFLPVSPIIIKCMKDLADTRCIDTTLLNEQQLEAIAHCLHGAWNAGYVLSKDS